jgi:hypothetical protein
VVVVVFTVVIVVLVLVCFDDDLVVYAEAASVALLGAPGPAVTLGVPVLASAVSHAGVPVVWAAGGVMVTPRGLQILFA